MAIPPVFVANTVLTASQMNKVGLWLIDSSTPTAATSLNWNNVFTSDYENYLIYVTGSASSGSPTMTLQMRNGIINTGTNYYWTKQTNNYNAANTTSNGGGSTSSFDCATMSSLVTGSVRINLTRPQKSGATGFDCVATIAATSAQMTQGVLNDSTSYDGFRLVSSTAATLSLSVEIYGYHS